MLLKLLLNLIKPRRRLRKVKLLKKEQQMLKNRFLFYKIFKILYWKRKRI